MVFLYRGGFSFRARRSLMCALLFLIALFSASPAWSQADAPGLDAIRSQMDKGQGLFLAKKYDEAAAAFEEGYKSYPYSAFLFNAGVCYQKLGRAEAALSAFGKYLKTDPNAPDASAVKERVEKIKEALASAEAAAKVDGVDEPGGPPESVELPDDSGAGMKSLVIIETEPGGAPVKVYRRSQKHAPEFTVGAKNILWQLVAERPAPVNLTLDVGRYHIVIEEYRDYNRASTNLDVSPGHVHHFKANLSQGEFTGFLEVKTNVVGATIYLDDDGSRKTVWGQTPHGALIAPGEHTVLVEAPGYEAVTQKVALETGEKKELEIELKRVGFGVLRLDADVGEVTLTVDDKPIGVWRQGQAAFEVELSAGTHEVLVSSRGYKDLRQTVTIPRGQVLPMRARMVERYPRGAAWTQAILAAGFVGAGVYFGVESNRLNRDLAADREAGFLHESDPRLRQGFWYSVGADSGFAIGGILGLLATYNFIRDPYPDPKLQIGKEREFKQIRRPTSAAVGGASRGLFGSTFDVGIDIVRAPVSGGIK